MIALAAIESAMASWPKPRIDGTTVVVPTHCLYPTNHIVNVYIEEAEREFTVHDNGEALDQLRAMGGHEPAPGYLIRAAVRRDGLSVSEGYRIFAPNVRIDGLAGAVALVANAARDAADLLIAHHRPLPRRPLSQELEAILDVQFPSLWRKEEAIVGQSNKHHRFDYTIAVDHNRKILLDIAKPDASSINAAVVANLDVRTAHPNAFIQRIVYDDADSWSAENLSLLRVGAPPIALRVANDHLSRLAA